MIWFMFFLGLVVGIWAGWKYEHVVNDFIESWKSY
jgi:hypothetical protein